MAAFTKSGWGEEENLLQESSDELTRQQKVTTYTTPFQPRVVEEEPAEERFLAPSDQHLSVSTPLKSQLQPFIIVYLCPSCALHTENTQAHWLPDRNHIKTTVIQCKKCFRKQTRHQQQSNNK